MPKVIILMRHKGVCSPVFVCVIMWLGLQPLPTVKESTREENRGCPFHLPPPTSLSDSLYKCLAVLRMAGSNFPQCVNQSISQVSKVAFDGEDINEVYHQASHLYSQGLSKLLMSRGPMADYPHASAACLCYLDGREGGEERESQRCWMFNVLSLLTLPCWTVHAVLLAI